MINILEVYPFNSNTVLKLHKSYFTELQKKRNEAVCCTHTALVVPDWKLSDYFEFVLLLCVFSKVDFYLIQSIEELHRQKICLWSTVFSIGCSRGGISDVSVYTSNFQKNFTKITLGKTLLLHFVFYHKSHIHLPLPLLYPTALC